MKKFIDPYIKNKSKKSNEVFQFFPGTNLPLPSEIEISESGICNRKCSFCPRSDPKYEDIKEFISKDLVSKIANELSDLNYRGVIRFSGFVEPMLDKKIFDQKNFCWKCFLESKTGLFEPFRSLSNYFEEILPDEFPARQPAAGTGPG